MVNNFEVVEKNLLHFEPGTYYKFEAIIRQKDGENGLMTNPNSTSLKFWLIDSQESYNKLKPIMKKFCDVTKSRLYFTLDRKSTYKTFVNTLKTLTEVIGEIVFGGDFSINKLNKIINSETSKKENTDKLGCKTWLIDIDIKNDKLRETIEKYCNKEFICTLNTLNGYHVISKKNFSAYKFIDLLETYILLYFKDNKEVENLIHQISLHENSLGLIYKGE